jgi:hypothetical protein
MYSLVTYIPITRNCNIIKRVLLTNGDPTHYLAGMNKLCYPIAISPLTKRQFNQMTDAFPTIEIVRLK